jgi:hypothetical protein
MELQIEKNGQCSNILTSINLFSSLPMIGHHTISKVQPHLHDEHSLHLQVPVRKWANFSEETKSSPEKSSIHSELDKMTINLKVKYEMQHTEEENDNREQGSYYPRLMSNGLFLACFNFSLAFVVNILLYLS